MIIYFYFYVCIKSRFNFHQSLKMKKKKQCEEPRRKFGWTLSTLYNLCYSGTKVARRIATELRSINLSRKGSLLELLIRLEMFG